jgi:hypothetical protein
MLKEEFLHMLMGIVYDKNSLNIYDYTANNFPPEGEEFRQCRDWSDQLVQEKLAIYTDKERTIIHLTNYGRYWMLQGGYEAFLLEGQRKRDSKKSRELEKEKMSKEKEELLEARLKLTHIRLWGFWLTLIISLIGFTLSLFNLYLILRNKN